MFGFKRKRNENENVLCEMDGREIKYVTRRIKSPDGSVKETIIGKAGRIVVIDGEIRIMCGEKDVFKCMAENATYYTLLSGDGITVTGVNSLNGEHMDMIVYYSYHRK